MRKKANVVSKKTTKKSVSVKKVSSKRTRKNNGRFILRLYIAGQTPRCIAALANLKNYFDTNFPGEYTIKVIDLLKNPQLAKDNQILAIPTIIKSLPKPVRRAIGDFSDIERMLVGLDIHPKKL